MVDLAPVFMGDEFTKNSLTYDICITTVEDFSSRYDQSPLCFQYTMMANLLIHVASSTCLLLVHSCPPISFLWAEIIPTRKTPALQICRNPIIQNLATFRDIFILNIGNSLYYYRNVSWLDLEDVRKKIVGRPVMRYTGDRSHYKLGFIATVVTFRQALR